MIIGQHVTLSKAAALQHSSNNDNYVGIICTKTPLLEVAEDAAENAKFICRDFYGLYGGTQKIGLVMVVVVEEEERDE